MPKFLAFYYHFWSQWGIFLNIFLVKWIFLCKFAFPMSQSIAVTDRKRTCKDLLNIFNRFINFKSIKSKVRMKRQLALLCTLAIAMGVPAGLAPNHSSTGFTATA